MKTFEINYTNTNPWTGEFNCKGLLKLIQLPNESNKSFLNRIETEKLKFKKRISTNFLQKPFLLI